MQGSFTHEKISVVASDATLMGCQLLLAALSKEPDFAVVDCVATSKALVGAVAERQPDVVLISSMLEDGPLSGIEVLAEIREMSAKTAPILLMDARNPEVIVNAFRGGAKGVFFREEPFEMLCKCIRTIHTGQLWASSTEVQHIVEALRQSVPVKIVSANGDDLLTSRQKQLVMLVSQGMTNREISQHLHLSEHTVKNYLFRVFDKLGVSSRAELIIHTLHQRNRSFV
jgi:DNA-binding NarL/FixJ family response regulator